MYKCGSRSILTYMEENLPSSLAWLSFLEGDMLCEVSIEQDGSWML
jgi:hypothetical protein